MSKNKVTSRRRKILTKIECCGVKFSHQNCLGVLVLARNDKKFQAQRVHSECTMCTTAHDQAADKAEVSVDAALHKCMWIAEEG